MLKSMIKTMQVGRLTSQLTLVSQQQKRDQLVAVTDEEKLLIRYVVETEPDLFTDFVSYWLFQKFMGESQASNFTTEETAYSQALEFILQKFETESNLVLYNDKLFTKWIKFLQKVPDVKSNNLKTRFEQHLRVILDKVKTTNLK